MFRPPSSASFGVPYDWRDGSYNECHQMHVKMHLTLFRTAYGQNGFLLNLIWSLPICVYNFTVEDHLSFAMDEIISLVSFSIIWFETTPITLNSNVEWFQKNRQFGKRCIFEQNMWSAPSWLLEKQANTKNVKFTIPVPNRLKKTQLCPGTCDHKQSKFDCKTLQNYSFCLWRFEKKMLRSTKT